MVQEAQEEQAANAKVVETKLVQRFIDELIAAGAVLFGGAVRDMLLAQHHEAAYYAAGGTVAGFFDPAVLPETRFRALLPEDVDAFVCEDDFDEVERVWHRMNLAFTRRVSVGSEYVHASNTTTHFRYTFETVRADMLHADRMLAGVHPDLRPFVRDAVATFATEMGTRTAGCRRELSMDLLVVKREEMENPFLVRPDFDVNGLFMDGRGVWLSPSMVPPGATAMARHVRMQEILEGVRARRARYTGWDDASNQRLLKMLRKGWTVPMCLVREAREAYDGHCILCHEAVPETHLKLACCDARYHPGCMADAARSMCAKGRCVMCSRAVDAMRLFVDATILRPRTDGFDVAPTPAPPEREDADMPALVSESDLEEEEVLLRALPSLAHLAIPPPLTW